MWVIEQCVGGWDQVLSSAGGGFSIFKTLKGFLWQNVMTNVFLGVVIMESGHISHFFKEVVIPLGMHKPGRGSMHGIQ